MKIPKLYTRGQFIDLMEQDEIGPSKRECFEFESEKYDRIIKYNSFLKQPLTKDMFVCDGHCPKETDFMSDDGFDDLNACAAVEEYEAAQKKVIFDGWEYDCDEASEDFKFGTTIISFFHKGEIFLNDENFEGIIDTLHDLAEATKGKLKLKNVEL